MYRNIRPSILQEKDAANLYLLVLIQWELQLKSNNKGFNFEASAFKKFRQAINLDCNAFDKSEKLEKRMRVYIKSDAPSKNMILFLKGDNKARSLIRALRNAAAHGGVKEKKIGSRWYITLDGSYRGKQNLYGRIQRKDFEEFLHALMSTAEHV